MLNQQKVVVTNAAFCEPFQSGATPVVYCTISAR
jgi:hypothetical protein